MDLSFVARFLPSLLEGTLVTLELSVLAIAAALILGMVIALAALSGRKALTLSAGAFVQSMRNTPLLVQLYLVYFGRDDRPQAFRLRLRVGRAHGAESAVAEIYPSGLSVNPRDEAGRRSA
jgi:His/Glu/Gln/Arg/opine family amino acid ABC transporter permease subunit